MKTKEKILSKALELFNERGYNTTTTRHIAAELNISAGNLHYHFKHSEDIIKILFSALTLKMNDQMKKMKETGHKTLDNLYQFTFSTFEIFYAYRFIFMNFVDILKKIPEIESHYEAINASRKEEFQEIFSSFQKNNIMRDDIPDFIMDSLTAQVFLIADNWITHNRLISKLTEKEAIQHYTLLQMNLFYPLLTTEQQDIYQQKYIQ
ncbi:hypothetical protein HX13_03555 [Chryseobacterium sp. P1-3]|uniref:TetR/AcrR family transcriptional regulator n=1 Tax=Chryseobacterium sp. (strain P1-3) TaxID=1517683 RepID=UPI0004E65F5D|nr:TetR/AcrR family transcriptional regulator [Chryseobacterium sp. P1-3]KFF75314.1 hypothetical protein HX13_03555 [Chryseobacterium sp. P1-3]